MEDEGERAAPRVGDLTTRMINLFELTNYTFGTKDAQMEKDGSVEARMSRMKQKFEEEGIKHTVEAVMIVHRYQHPHVLLIKIGTTFFKLPGGRLRPGEDPVAGLKRKLTTKLAPPIEDYQPDWEVTDILCEWWRPNFDKVMFPYVPRHITRPKERKTVFLVPLPEKCMFSVPRNLKLVAVPLFDLYENSARFGPVIAAIPQLVGRFSFIYNSPADEDTDISQ